MAGSSGNPEALKGATRNSSIDSALSAISGRNGSQHGAADGTAGASEIAMLISAAGSPEAVIQYLLKEKQANSQQNAQLWRLVDKQRAMILGLNKDLERALKDKEKYRKKLKEVIVASETQPSRPNNSAQLRQLVIPRIDVNTNKELVESPQSAHSIDEPDSAKESPVDMALAPYPITPPADRIVSAGPPSAVGELLDPRSAMPKASEHALDNYDHEVADTAVAAAKLPAGTNSREIPYNAALPPSRSLPSAPPTMPPPKPPGALPSLTLTEGTPMMGPGSPQFPPPPTAPPPRKPPPAPLQLKKGNLSPTLPPPDADNDSESDYDDLLDVDELPMIDKRGRRRTREEDDRVREILAFEEAQVRSQSGKSKQSTPTQNDMSISPKSLPMAARMPGVQLAIARENASASLAGVLNGDDDVRQTTLTAPMMNPGLPASPRPMAPKSLLGSPPLSPRGIPVAPLSPRPPRQNIPLPPGTPLSAASSTDVQRGTPGISDAPMQRIVEAAHPSPPTSRQSPTTRTRIFDGFKTDEYPDLLLPPNALPSIEVKVASSRMKPPRASMISLTQLEEDPVFTLAIYSRAEGGELWRVEKDTTSFGRLDSRLKQCAAFTAKTPDRSLFTGHAPAKLDARRQVLEGYLHELLDTPLDSASALELCKYLSTNALPPNTDDMGSTVGQAAEEAGTQQKGPGGRPFKTGYLTKRGKNFGGWKARFFVLEGPQLRYFESPGGAHLGTIKLQKAQIGKQSQHNNDAGSANGEDSDNQYRHAFLVMEPKKKDSSSHVKHVLCAESDVERDQWVETLLHWIDYVEPGNEDSSVAQLSEIVPRRGSASQVQKSGGQIAKKKSGPSKGHATHGGSQDGLIGMSYDSAKAGSAPDGAPQRGRGTATPDIMHAPLSATFNISGPSNPQPIADTTMWSGRAGLAIPGPTHEEKKQRKRSFFGFGPKTRSSTDDQDSLYGSSAPSVTQVDSRGLVRQVFGAQLADAVRYNGPADTNVPLPSVVYRCIQYLDAKNAILEEGIFRLSGSNVVIKGLRERFNIEGDINLVTDETYYDIHAVASLLKLYLRELPTTILTRDLHMQFISVSEMTVQKDRLAALAELCLRLPQANATLLKYLIAFLIKVINHAEHNKMTVRNVGIVFSPTLNIPAPIFALLLGNYEAVFGIEPEAYELPSPDASDADSRSTFEAPPRRPSTGAGTGPIAESPHRQRLLEQIHQHRGSPTPPPIINGSLRPANTPPPRMSSYEPFYPGLVGVKEQSSRGQYDQQAVHSNTLYESEQDEELDQGLTGRARRRESVMFMGGQGLSAQASKSRLREETRM
ncbi:RalA-binding protein 1 [Microdochium nivale]|nr:RalA-binding protein 1 [Microdochium nivale]